MLREELGALDRHSAGPAEREAGLLAHRDRQRAAAAAAGGGGGVRARASRAHRAGG